MGRKPFARAEKWSAGWYAVADAGICSGPWPEDKARAVAAVWNEATKSGAEAGS